jgi:hypothetical protein
MLKGNEEQITQQRNDITELAKRYNAACLKCVSEFENYAMNDVKPLPPDGTVHELTRYDLFHIL